MAFQAGELNPRWNGGKTLTSDGYYRIKAGEHRDEMEHRVLWEKAKGKIPDGFDVHHKNEIRTDNRLENFELRESMEHRTEVLKRLHTRQKKRLATRKAGRYHTVDKHTSKR